MSNLPEVSRVFSKKVKKRKSAAVLKKYFVIIFCVFIVVLFASGDYGLIKIYRLHNRIKETRQEIKRLQVQAIDAKWEINKLTTDSSYICRYASEHYVYARPGAKVIQFATMADTSR